MYIRKLQYENYEKELRNQKNKMQEGRIIEVGKMDMPQQPDWSPQYPHKIPVMTLFSFTRYR